MIYRRVAARLKAQDWVAITIELTIVVVGVFIGTWVANWNQEREEKTEIGRLIEQLRPEISRLRGITSGMRTYYQVTGQFADVALAGWRSDPAVNDQDFVIAAYQASQVAGISSDSQNYSQLLGGEQVRKIDDAELREAIMRIMNYDYEPLSLPVMRTRYRENVRQVVPEAIAKAIRSECGDSTEANGVIALPARCDIDLPAVDFATAAASLRTHPELAGELRVHQSLVSAFLFSLERLEMRLHDVAKRIAQ